ncbi:major facilitator superfamily domain-containing protein [Aspergillus bertholletiae]|uniref:Major facilitator superfamily domain-containing protein n=1 Tax=Aspergillus bertholletiae TaxID=1226010 RepID=A0A5N7BJ47_9EURO|nr:major facilitator superfamily domain-containing protein [Aspergillus bertholletiae]
MSEQLKQFTMISPNIEENIGQSNLVNAKTDGLDDDLNFQGNDYSLLILLFYIPFGLFDHLWNLLIKRYSMSRAAKNFGSLLAIRIILGIFEAGFFAGATFYLTLFYTRGEMGFRLAIIQLFAVLASAFSGLISFGVFQIERTSVKGWQYLFIIKGGMTLLIRQFPIWCIITFTYPVAYATAMNFFPLIVQYLGYSVVKTNLWMVAPNLAGAVVLLSVAKSSDYLRERTFHIVFSLALSLVGIVILATIDILQYKGVANFTCFLMASGAYIPSCLVHAWHNNNNVHENSRAANTGFFVGLENLIGVVNTATFWTKYAPKYLPTLVATCCCNAVCIVFVIGLGLWMRFENRCRDRNQGLRVRVDRVDTSQIIKNHPCEHLGCGKSFTCAEYLRRHALNHEQSRKSFTCKRCTVHFQHPDLLARHMLRHDKRDEEAGGPGLGVLNTRKRTRRARDSTIIVCPSQREMRSGARSTTSSLTTGQDVVTEKEVEEEEGPIGEAPISPPISSTDPSSLPIVDTDPFLAPMMPGDPFEPYVEPIPGQFDAADRSFNVGLDSMGDFFSMDTDMGRILFQYDLFDVASLDDAFHQFDFPLGFDTESFPSALNTEYNQAVDKYNGPSALLEVVSMINKEQTSQSTLSPIMPDILETDWMSGTSFLGSKNSRRDILSLVMQLSSIGIDGRPRTLDSPLLTLRALQGYCNLFFTRFNITYPLVHQPTFNPDTINLIFLAAFLFMGATYSTREAHQLAVGIHDKLRNQLLYHEEFSPQPDFWVLQTMLLINYFGKIRAGPKQRKRAQLFHCVLIKLIHCSNCCKTRLILLAFEIQSSLPCSAATWEALSAREIFLTVLKGYITPGSMSRPRDLNIFAHTVILHGLMSVSADLKRRDQTTLRSETPERVGAWTPRMSRSYVLWKVDFDADYLAMKLGQTADPRRFTGLKMAAHTLYHVSCLALNVEIIDLQIVAGAMQILRRTVTPADQSRSQQNIIRWLHNNSGASTAVAQHASHLFTTELAALSGKYDPRPLVAAMAQQLATVQWAVVHDAMKVLVDLS